MAEIRIEPILLTESRSGGKRIEARCQKTQGMSNVVALHRICQRREPDDSERQPEEYPGHREGPGCRLNAFQHVPEDGAYDIDGSDNFFEPQAISY